MCRPCQYWLASGRVVVVLVVVAREPSEPLSISANTERLGWQVGSFLEGARMKKDRSNGRGRCRAGALWWFSPSFLSPFLLLLLTPLLLQFIHLLLFLLYSNPQGLQATNLFRLSELGTWTGSRQPLSFRSTWIAAVTSEWLLLPSVMTIQKCPLDCWHWKVRGHNWTLNLQRCLSFFSMITDNGYQANHWMV